MKISSVAILVVVVLSMLIEEYTAQELQECT